MLGQLLKMLFMNDDFTNAVSTAHLGLISFLSKNMYNLLILLMCEDEPIDKFSSLFS